MILHGNQPCSVLVLTNHWYQRVVVEFREAVLNKAGRSASDMKLGAIGAFGAIGRKTKHACKHIIMYLLKAGKQLHRSILTPS